MIQIGPSPAQIHRAMTWLWRTYADSPVGVIVGSLAVIQATVLILAVTYL